MGAGSGSQIWNLTGDPHVSDPKFSLDNSDQNFYFNPKAFVVPAGGTFTTQRNRNLLYNPGFQNWTGALFKSFTVHEGQAILFRGEVFNIPNHANWNSVVNDPTNSQFGKVNNKNFERTIQLSLRYEF